MLSSAEVEYSTEYGREIYPSRIVEKFKETASVQDQRTKFTVEVDVQRKILLLY